jgi:FtsZ-interacting cell division protein YlmF
MGALKKKPKAYKEADEFIKTIIIGNAVMIDLGLIDKHAELI